MTDVNFLIALVYGALSFVSPCVLPLVPAYITYITGKSLEELQKEKKAMIAVNSLLFIAGFSIVFTLMGASSTFVGKFLLKNQDTIRKIAGIIIIIFGLHLARIVDIGFLNMEKKMHFNKRPRGFFGSLLIGVAFAAGWSPCIGPILGSILTIAASSDTIFIGMLLLATYSLGLGVPFFLTSIAIGRFLKSYQRVYKYMDKITYVSGILLVIVGILMLLNLFKYLSGYFIWG